MLGRVPGASILALAILWKPKRVLRKVVILLILAPGPYAALHAREKPEVAIEQQPAAGTLLLDVKQAEAVGIHNDPTLKVIRYQRVLRGLVVDESWREYLSTASVSWDRSKAIVDNEDDSRSQSIRLNVDQVVYDGGRRGLALDAAKSDLALSRYDYRLAVTDLKFRIRQAFYSILSSRARLNSLQRSRERQERQLEFAERELELGETTQVEVLEIRNRTNEIILQEKTAQIEYKNAVEEFKLLLRLESNVRLRLKGDILTSVVYRHRAFRNEAMISRGFAERVEFPRTKAQALQATAEHKIAKSYYIPQISVGGFYGFTGDRYPPREKEWGVNFRISMLLGPNTFSDSSNYTSRSDGRDRSVSSGTSLNIVDRLDYKRSIVETGISATEAKINLNQLPEQIRIEIMRALDTYRESWQAMQLADENIGVFEKRLEINELQLELGDIRRVDLAETEIRYLEAKNAQIEARVRYLISVAQLELAVGLQLDELKLVEIR